MEDNKKIVPPLNKGTAENPTLAWKLRMRRAATHMDNPRGNCKHKQIKNEHLVLLFQTRTGEDEL